MFGADMRNGSQGPNFRLTYVGRKSGPIFNAHTEEVRLTYARPASHKRDGNQDQFWTRTPKSPSHTCETEIRP